MLHPLPARWLAALPAFAALSAFAQTPPALPPGEPLPYRSAFENYLPFRDDKPIPWKQANDTVRERGGWRAYAQQGADGGQADPHAGHGTQRSQDKPHDSHDGAKERP